MPGRLLLHPRMPRAHAALDRGGDQRVELQFGAHELQHVERRRLGALVAGDDLAGQRIGGLAQPRGQRGARQLAGVLQAVFLVQQVDRGFGGLGSIAPW